MIVEPVVLEGENVRLEPLALRHADDLLMAAQEPGIWLFMPADPSRSLDGMKEWIAETISAQSAGTILPFAIVDQGNGRAVGSTRYLDIRPEHRGLEIGWTWLGREARRTPINTECKYLLLRHAFETLGAIRVQLKTDERNIRSQTAIERIGGIREATLRHHMIMPDGFRRNTVYFSILEAEWPAVKERLEGMLKRNK